VCGIAGFTGSAEPLFLNRMLAVIANRGPDGQMQFVNERVSFGFSRLSINDLSDNGNQPMFSNDDRLISMMNGEIYNAPELRRELESLGYRFRGSSDAEVVPHGYAEWGTELFGRLRGMFAIAVFDRGANQLTLARDHFGIKPLYYAKTSDGVVFSSSARAVSLHSEVGQGLSEKSIVEFLRFRYVQSGEPLYERVRSLQPGFFLQCGNSEIRLVRYWSRPRYESQSNASFDEQVEQFEAALSTSVRRELLSDVPLGVLLSGGVDSGAVLAAAGGTPELIAYTFDMGGSTSEVRNAEVISRRYGARHVVVNANRDDFVDTFVKAIQCMDLPVGDAIIAPTYQLLGEVRKERKVVLTGEGADELMAGYVHIGPLKLLGSLASMGIPARSLAAVIRCVPWRVLNHFFAYDAVLGRSGKRKVIEIVNHSRRPELALAHATSVFGSDQVEMGTYLSSALPHSPIDDLSLSSLIDWGFSSWLPNQILNKMDQLSMAHGVEARVPFVDVDLYERVTSLESSMLLSRRGNKRILRETLKKWGYQEHQRPKQAFFQPMTDQHIADLERVAREWLSASVVAKHGIVRNQLVTDVMSELRSGDFLAGKQVMTLAALHIWLDQDFRR